MKRSRLSYDEWKCIISKDIFGRRLNSELLNGYIGLIDIKEVSEAQIWKFNGEDFEYWSHNSLDETAYLMFHESYPPVHNVELIFWKYKQGVVLDDQTVYEKYRFGKGDSKELEALPLEEMLKKIRKEFSGWQENTDAGRDGSSWRFDCLEQKEYWTDTHFWIFIYGRETEAQSESQILRFSCHNMNEEQINIILECMENFQCPLHIREENNHY